VQLTSEPELPHGLEPLARGHATVEDDPARTAAQSAQLAIDDDLEGRRALVGGESDADRTQGEGSRVHGGRRPPRASADAPHEPADRERGAAGQGPAATPARSVHAHPSKSPGLLFVSELGSSNPTMRAPAGVSTRPRAVFDTRPTRSRCGS